MWTKSRLLSAMVGAAMLAVPVSAFAGRDHDFRGQPNAWHYGFKAQPNAWHDGFKAQPNAWHDSGWHQGWVNHEINHDRWEANHNQWEHNRFWRAENGYGYPPAVNNVPPRTVYWDPAPYQPGYYPAAPYQPGYPAPVAPYNSAWNYGAPMSYYQALPPSSYNPSQQVSWLLERRQQAYVVLSRMRARHDRDASNRMLTQINNINARISAINHQNGYAPQLGYAPATAAPYAANPLVPAYNSYAGGYSPAYGGAAPSYMGANPMLGNLGSVVGPLLGLPY
jgi:hypothetical protein